MLNVPAPETEGSKFPPASTPVPDHVPPAEAVVNAIGGSVSHSVAGIQIVASQHVIAIGLHAEAAKDCTPPDRLLDELVPVPPHAIMSPLVVTRTS